MEIHLKVLRGSGVDAERFTIFDFTVPGETTILDLLMEAGRGDGTLLFRHSCHHGSCGTCACIINGTERLACRTPVSLFDPGSTVEVRPLSGFPRIRDLVADMSEMFAFIGEEWGYLRASDAGGERFESCIECGACMSACPVTEPFQGPAPLALLHRRLESIHESGEPSPETEHALLAQAARGDGAAACRRHIACSRVCPQNVSPARRIQLLKNRLNGDA